MKILVQRLGFVLTLLLLGQILWTLWITGQKVIFRSTLSLWLNPDYFWYQKVEALAGGEYIFSQKVKDLPVEPGYLAVAPEIGNLWFVNYYLFPRKLFYQGATKEAELKKIPEEWFKKRNIEYVLFWDPPNVRIEKLETILRSGPR